MADTQLPDVPDGMNAQIRHEGVTWRFSNTGDTFQWIIAVLTGLTGMVGCLAMSSLGAVGTVATAMLVLLVATLLASRITVSTRATVTDRSLTVEHRRPFATERLVLRLDDLTVAKLTTHGDCAVFRADDTVVAVGIGQPAEQIEWFLAAVHVACEEVAAREEAEGREFTFLRRAPESLRALDKPRS